MELTYYELVYLYNMLIMYGNKQKRNIRKNKLGESIIEEYKNRLRTNNDIAAKLRTAINKYK